MKKVFTALAILAIFQSIPVYAGDTLDQVFNSSEFQSLEGPRKKKANQGPQKDSNYQSYFRDIRGASILEITTAWLGRGSKEYELKSSFYKRGDRTISVMRTYVRNVDGEAHEIYLDLIVPLPAYLNAAKMDLVEELISLSPPRLKVSSQDESDIQGNNGIFYTLRDTNEGLLTLELSKEAMLVARTKLPEDRAMMVELIRSLTLGRFNQKMNT